MPTLLQFFQNASVARVVVRFEEYCNLVLSNTDMMCKKHI